MTKAKKKKKPETKQKQNGNKRENKAHTHTHARTHIHLTTRRNFLDVSVFCSVNSQWTAVAKWLIKENEEGHDICMAATGFLFLALKIQKRGDVWVRPTLSKRKILVCTSLYCTCELLNPCPKHTVQGPHCAETSLRVVQLATKQNRTVDDTL